MKKTVVKPTAQRVLLVAPLAAAILFAYGEAFSASVTYTLDGDFDSGVLQNVKP